MPEHDGVVVHINDSAGRVDPLGDLMGVVDRGQSCADVQELPDARLAGEEPHGAREELPVGHGGPGQGRYETQDLIADFLVDGVVVLAAQPVVPDAGRVRHIGAEPGHVGAAFVAG